MKIKPRNSTWPADRVAEARAVIADVALHSDHLIRLACNVLVVDGQTAPERMAKVSGPACTRSRSGAL